MSAPRYYADGFHVALLGDRPHVWLECYREGESAPDVAADVARRLNAYDGALTALADCAEALSRLPDTDGAYRVTCLQQARAALAKLEGR